MKDLARIIIMGLGLLSAVGAAAQSTGTEVISEIEVVGALTVSPQQVLAWSGLEVGRIFTNETVAAGIRRLFLTQKFSDIYVYRQDLPSGVKLIINLREFPRIRSISYQGNHKIKNSDISETFPVSVGQFANPAVINRHLETIRVLYYEKGYFNVQVNTDSSRVDLKNMQDLVVTVVEGKKVKVVSISLVGNQNITSGELRGAIKQGTTGFLKSGTFKKQQFEEDKERIVAYYRNQGFLDADVVDVQLNFQEGREKLDIVISVYEGEQYKVGDIHWVDNTVFDDLIIADNIRMTRGDVFSEGEYHFTLQRLHSLYADNGYIYITVEPMREIVDHNVNITFHFREGEPARIRHIQIVNNIKTHDNVILRQLRIYPGDVFSNVRIANSQRDIFQLGYFEEVMPDFRPVGEEGDVDLILKVKDRKTGQFMFGMAYSAQTAVTGFIQVAETNFRGKGQNIAVAWQFGSRRRYIDLSFTEPWFRGTPLLLGLDIFDRFQYNIDDFYESRIRGFSVRLGRRIWGTRFSRIGLRYELSNTRLSNFSQSYTRFLDRLEDQLGTSDLPWQRLDQVVYPQSKSAIRMTLSRNSTDNPFFPTGGSRTTYSVELSGGPLGGEINYQEHLLSHSYYQRLPGGFALHLRGYFGIIEGLDRPNDVPDYEKYRLGGNRLFPLRGYQDLEVVPKGNPIFIGGRFFTIFNMEVLYPLTNAIQVLAFLDQGDTWNSFSQADFTNLRRGAGFGIRVEVPMMGNIGFDYGYGFDRFGGPSWEPHFNIGSFF